MILEERQPFDDDVEYQEDVSKCEDHISENSESDSDFEEEDEIEHQLVTTTKTSHRTSRSAGKKTSSTLIH